MEKSSKDELFVIKDGLFGREKDVNAIVDLYKKARTNESSNDKLILVRGPAGAGKTTLVVKALKNLVERDGGFFISGKFDQQVGTEPYSAITSAFTDLIDTISANDEDSGATKEKLSGTLGEDAHMLIRMLPSLSNIIDEDADARTTLSTSSETRNKFMFVFRSLTRVLSDSDHPLVVFIDDLQWADESSLALLKTLATDSDNDSLLIIGAYRDSEVADEHSLTSLIGELERVGVGVTQIYIGNLSREYVNDMICATIDQDPEMTWFLTDIVIQETGGNAFFARQLLQSFYDEGLLYFDHANARWCWDTKRIQEREATDVIDLIIQKLHKFPEELQSALKIAAAMGSEIEPSMFDQVSANAVSSLDQIVENGGVLLKKNSGAYVFAHDRVQQAAYSMIPMQERPAFHLQIGRALWSATSTEDFHDNLFLIVYHLNRGARLLAKRSELYDVARLNLLAGTEAMSSSAFASAEIYFDNGIDLLCEEHWKDMYGLSLELYSSAAEATLPLGKYEKTEKVVAEVLDNAVTFHDKLRAYSAKVNSIGARGNIKEAMRVGFKVLEQLGERFPSRPRKYIVAMDLMKTRRILRTRSDELCLDLPMISDRDKLAALHMLSLVYAYAYQGWPEYFPLIAFRIIRLSLDYGASALTSVGFAAFALIMCGVLEEVHEGYRYGQLALAYLKKFPNQNREYLPQVYVTVFAFVTHWTKPFRSCLEPLSYAHHIGLEIGDIEAAAIASYLLLNDLYWCGKPLPFVEEEAIKYRRRMVALNQTGATNAANIFLQTIHNFMGRSPNPLILTGEITEEQAALRFAIEMKNKARVTAFHLCKAWLAYYFGDFEGAKKLTKRTRSAKRDIMGHQHVVTQCFIEGLAAIAIARTRNKRANIRLARKRIAKMKKYASMSAENNGNKLALMEAELAAFEGKHDIAVFYYNKSIRLAGREGFLHEQALACERAAQFLQQSARDDEVQKQFVTRAVSLYAEWGSAAKVDHVKAMFNVQDDAFNSS